MALSLTHSPHFRRYNEALLLDYIYVFVYNVNTSAPIAGAIVKNYVGGTLLGSGITDSVGKAKILITTTQVNHFIISARGFITAETEDTFFTKHNVYVYLTPEPTPPPEDQYYADFYLVDNAKRRVKDAKVISAYEENISNEQGLVRLLLPQGVNDITIQEYYAVVKIRLVWTRIYFPDFSGSINISYDSTYTVWVEQGVIQTGMPPPPPFDPWGLLAKYWWAIPIGLGGIYALSLFKPHVVVKVER